jgi:hypothetical protein
VANWKLSIKAGAIGLLVGTAFGILTFLFVSSRQYPGMGSAMFLVAPIAAGLTIGLIAKRPDSTIAAGLVAVLCTLVILIAMGREGVLCAILALPIIVAGLAIGVLIAWLIHRFLRKRGANQNITTGFLLLIGPLLIFAGERIERPMLAFPRSESVQTTVVVNNSLQNVWQDLLSIDNVRAEKPFLMYVGLPIPERCTTRGSGVGAKRTCFFNVGYIEETVTAWNPPYDMALAIDRTHMPGRHWLAFEEAEYQLRTQGPMTVLTRTTAFTSRLHPAWYWRPLERLGVESEHRYILQDIELRAGK